jgi:hypothetical protein
MGNIPKADYVRQDQLKIWKKFIGDQNLSESTENLIKDILLIHIPDSKTWFGTSMEYHDFGLQSSLKIRIEVHITRMIHLRKKAIKTLRLLLIPYLNHYLYKPGGQRYISLLTQTKVGKKKIN